MTQRSAPRSVLTVGLAAALLLLPLSASALALSTVDEVLAPVTELLPPAVNDAVDNATAPIKEAVDTQVAPVVNKVVEQVLASAPAPLRDLVGKVVPSKPSAGPVVASPPNSASGSQPHAAPAAPGPRDRLFRAGSALHSLPVTTTIFPLRDLFMAPAPVSASANQSASAAGGQGAPGWLVATAAGLLVLLAAAHITYADQRWSSGAAHVKA